MAKIGRPDCREAVLAALPGIRNRIAKRAGVSVSSAGKWLVIFHTQGLTYVSGWRRQKNNGAPLPLYKLKVKGSEIDKPRPPPMTDADYQRRFQERHPTRRAEIRRAYEDRQLEAKKKRKMLLAAWAAPLNVVVSKSY